MLNMIRKASIHLMSFPNIFTPASKATPFSYKYTKLMYASWEI